MLPDYVGTGKPEINLDLQNIRLAMMTITEMDKIKEAEAEEIRKGKQNNLLFFLIQKHPPQQLLKSKH